jgi:hypothetical protein
LTNQATGPASSDRKLVGIFYSRDPDEMFAGKGTAIAVKESLRGEEKKDGRFYFCS